MKRIHLNKTALPRHKCRWDSSYDIGAGLFASRGGLRSEADRPALRRQPRHRATDDPPTVDLPSGQAQSDLDFPGKPARSDLTKQRYASTPLRVQPRSKLACARARDGTRFVLRDIRLFEHTSLIVAPKARTSWPDVQRPLPIGSSIENIDGGAPGAKQNDRAVHQMNMLLRVILIEEDGPMRGEIVRTALSSSGAVD